MPFLPKIAMSMLTVLLSAVVIYLPFVAPPGLMQATQTGKAVYFLWALWLSLPFTVGALFSRRYGKINPFTVTDLLFLVWIGAGGMGRCNRAGVACTWGLFSKTFAGTLLLTVFYLLQTSKLKIHYE